MKAFLATLICSLALLQPSFAAKPPNILFAIADDWGPHASAYGTPWIKTPAFDRVAKEGLLFNNVYTPNAKCAPSRACILTGRNSWQLKEAANHICYFPTEFKGWGEALVEKGWNVGHTMKGWGPGVANDADGKPRLMTGVAWNKRKATPPTPEISNNDYAGNFTDFLDAAPAGKPWCFWYGSIEPHRGYEFGSGVKKGGKKLSDVDHVPAYWPDNEVVRNDILDYAFEAEHFDRHLGRMLAELEKRGLLENTLVIVTADHGMPFPRSKGNANAMANHVPFAAMWKGGILKPGRVIDDFVSFIDLAPTFIELAGFQWADTGMAPSPGRSLTEIFKSEKAGQVVAQRDHVLIGKERTDVGRPNDWGYPIRGIVTKDSVFIENFEPTRWPAGNPETGYMDCDAGATKSFILDAHRKDPKDRFWQMCFGMRPGLEFYDLKADPDMIRSQPENRRAAVLKAQMHTELSKQGDPRMEGKGDIFDKYEHSTKANVGFYEKFMRGEPVKAGWISPTDIEPRPLP
ncbi:MAG TPA: sulfatase [Roseimicrobium sp.]|nr:sulfatase [Roseimicrobium sp.]